MSHTILAGIDIGSFVTRIVVIERVDKKTKILARASTPSKGIEQGYITNAQEAKESITQVLATVEKQLGESIREIIISASGVGLESHMVSADTITTLGSGEVTELDITKSVERARKKATKQNRKIIEHLTTAHTLDNKPVKGSPIGMKGKKLETQTFFIDFPVSTIETLEEICDQLNIDILDIIPSPLACSCVSLSDIERKVGSVLVEIGSDTTTVLVYEHDVPLLLETIDFGGRDITNAIALTLKVSVEEAEQIKQGGPLEKKSDQTKVNTIISKKLTEVFKEINTILATIEKKHLLPAGVILSGGGALTKNIEKLAKEHLKIPARKGSPRSVKKDPDERDIPWAVCYGLAVLGLERKAYGAYGAFGNLGASVKGFMKKFFI